MVVDFSKLDMKEQPVLILKNTADVPIGTLGFAKDIAADIKFNEASVLEFAIPAHVDGVPTPYYDSVVGIRTVEWQDVGQFILFNPQVTGDGVKEIKQCSLYSLEYEFTFKKLSLPNATYNFWNPVAPDGTLLQIILEKMPLWSVGDIDDALIGKYRTFEVQDENLYNFIKGTAQNSYNCVFDFDTMNRRINVKSASSTVPTNPVFISNNNLAKEIVVTENTDNIVTRLDVNGAEGVTIRDVNPMGTNQIINLDYFMNTDNFPQEVIDKYWDWKETYTNYQQQYYNLSVEYALQVMRKTTEEAALTELNGEMTVLENEQAVTIQAIASNLKQQSDLDNVNNRIAAKQEEIDAQQAKINTITSDANTIYNGLKEINERTRFESFFTEDEYLYIDRFIKDDAVSESSFVVQESASYTDDDIGNSIQNKSISFSDATVSKVTNAQGKDIYNIKGGRVVSDFIDAEVISAAFEVSNDDSFVMTAYLSKGVSGENEFPKGCFSITGTTRSISHNLTADAEAPDMMIGSTLSVLVSSGYLYFTRNTSEYEKRAVAWELFEYGSEILEKISQPSYTFSVTSANFLNIDEFTAFKNSVRHGEKIYISLDDDNTLSPICVGMRLEFNTPSSLTLEFSDTYVSSDSSFLLADLLEQSVSMGKSVDLSKYSYSAFMDSGASTKVKEFMNTALDVSKNSIISSRNQAISWTDAGIRLRKWADEAHTQYDPKQVWMNNNSILMTKDNWSTAELAIGNFYDENLGDCWGIVAPNIVGTLLAGSNLIIESEKEDGGVAVFKVDAEGCFLHNSSLSVTNEDSDSHILLDPVHGLMIGKYPMIKADGSIDESKRLFYADTNGNLTLHGTIYATDGEFTGRVTAMSGYIGQPSQGWEIGSSAIYNSKTTYDDATQGIYIGVDGISLGDNTSFVRANKNGYLYANNVNITGHINAKSGYIGDPYEGWTIDSTGLYNGKSSYSDSTDGIFIGPDGISLSNGTSFIHASSNGTFMANNATITGHINATSGSIGGCNISNGVLQVGDGNITTIDGDKIITGTINGNKIIAGTLSVTDAEIVSVSADKITAGEIDANDVTIKNLTVDAAYIKNLTADKIITGGKNLGGSSTLLENLYAKNGYITYMSGMQLSLHMNSTDEGDSVYLTAGGIDYGDTFVGWGTLLDGAGSSTAVFG